MHSHAVIFLSRFYFYFSLSRFSASHASMFVCVAGIHICAQLDMASLTVSVLFILIFARLQKMNSDITTMSVLVEYLIVDCVRERCVTNLLLLNRIAFAHVHPIV